MKKRYSVKELTQALCLSIFFLSLPLFLSAQIVFDKSNPNAFEDFVALRDKPMAKKISTSLLSIMAKFDAGDNLEDDPMMSVINGKILVEVVANSLEETPNLLKELEELGMTQGVSFQRVINGYIGINKIENCADIPSLKRMRYVPTPVAQIGSVTSQGVEAMNLNGTTDFGLTGRGVKIGILSDSYNNLGGEAAGIASGDLPGVGNPKGKTTPVEVIQDLGGGGIDEGRGMIELVHDVAPDASIAFATAFGGEASFANNILRLRNQANCDVIVDDIGVLTAPAFQDGLVSQAVDIVTADGANYFSSAGNSADRSYEAPFDGGLGPDLANGIIGPYQLHDFTGNGDYVHGFTFNSFGSFRMTLWWDDPYESVSSPPGPGATADLAILLFIDDGFGNPLFIGGVDDNFSGDDAFEFAALFNPFPTGRYYVAIGRWLGAPAPNFVKYALWVENGVGSWDFDNLHNKSTCFAHPNSAGAMATGASAFFNTPAFGDDPAIINGFSSLGGTPILFDTNGNRLPQAIIRQKPDFVGPDGGNTTFFGQQLNDGDNFPNFFGTSASAPHLGALAVLVNEQYKTNNLETPTSFIRQLFIDNAQDMGAPGFDFKTGHGYVDGAAVLAAVIAAVPLPAMSKWGLILFSIAILGVGIYTMTLMRSGK